MHSTDASSRGRRTWLLLSSIAVIAVGLTTHFLGSGRLADLTGDALYAVMVYLVIAFVFPRTSVLVVGISALAICTAIEAFQATGLPAAWSEAFWPARLILGAGFDALDLVAYAAGVVTATMCDLALRSRSRA